MPLVRDILWFAFVLGAVMLVHELGHCAAARLLRIRIVTFSIGLGPQLFAFRYGKTKFQLSLLPFGSYVEMTERKQGEEPGRLQRTPAFRSPWKWLIVAVAGPLATVVLAVTLLTGLFMFQYREPTNAFRRAIVGDVVPESPAARAGIRPNDPVIRLENIDDPAWDALTLQELTGPDVLTVSVEREERQFQVAITPRRNSPALFGPVGWIPLSKLQISRTVPGMPASEAGKRKGDVLLEIDACHLE